MLMARLLHLPHRGRRRFKAVLGVPVALFIGGTAGAGYIAADHPLHDAFVRFSGADCNIKGNISINTGERIFHVPGQRYYDVTRISPQYGERWFCSEQEARQAGWRKSRQ